MFEYRVKKGINDEVDLYLNFSGYGNLNLPKVLERVKEEYGFDLIKETENLQEENILKGVFR